MTKRQRNKLPALEYERYRLDAIFKAQGSGSVWVTKALNRFDWHRAGCERPSWTQMHDDAEGSREGRFHVYWMRKALRQAAKLMGVNGNV
jgi:hypothetical protein